MKRKLLAISSMAAAAALGLTAATMPTDAAEDEIVLLGIWPFSGPYADVGPLLDHGAQVALEEVGHEAAGKKIKYITRDSETKAGTATRRAQEAIDGAAKGAYVVVDGGSKPDLILLANGSEASLMVEGAALLAQKGLKVRVVSAPSEGLFRDQSPAYQESVVPYGVPVLGWTAGEPSNLKGLVGPLGQVYGMTRFGASAPFKVLDEKFGYTAANVVAVAEKYLSDYKVNLKRLAELV